MLIRLCGHYFNNPAHIDKLISIKGLPEEWLFRPSRFGGKELIAPWEPDIEENIPKEIRHLCEPVEITVVFPPIEKGRDHVIDKKTIIGLKFSYMTEPGQTLWEKIERYLDKMTPRDQKVPVPVMVAPDHKASFNPHEARRTVRGSLELYKTEIPQVDLSKPALITEEVAQGDQSIDEKEQYERLKLKFETKPAVSQKPPIELVTQANNYKCGQCSKEFAKAQALRMHTMKAHPSVKREAVGV